LQRAFSYIAGETVFLVAPAVARTIAIPIIRIGSIVAVAIVGVGLVVAVAIRRVAIPVVATAIGATPPASLFNRRIAFG
jgi:hypothetical protein